MEFSSNTALVDAILGGAFERYAEVVERFERDVRAQLRRDTADLAELEELVHETFYLGFRDLSSLDSPGRLGAWLCSIARRRLADRRRRIARAKSRTPLSLEPQTEDQDDEELWEEIDCLPDLLATVLHLRYGQDMGYSEIAGRIGVPVSTVRGRLYEARLALRKRLDRLEKH